MSFGVSLSDITSIVQLGWQVYKGWRDACGHYGQITAQLNSVHALLQRLSTAAESDESILSTGRADGQRLAAILHGCNGTLKRLDRVLTAHQSIAGLSKSRRRNWDRLRYGRKSKEVETLTLQLGGHVNVITGFLATVTAEATGRVEGAAAAITVTTARTEKKIDGLPEILRETLAEAGFRPASPTGSCLTALTDDDPEIWRDLRRRLVDKGIRSDKIRQWQPQIEEYLQMLGGVIKEQSDVEGDREAAARHDRLGAKIEEPLDGWATREDKGSFRGPRRDELLNNSGSAGKVSIEPARDTPTAERQSLRTSPSPVVSEDATCSEDVGYGAYVSRQHKYTADTVDVESDDNKVERDSTRVPPVDETQPEKRDDTRHTAEDARRPFRQSGESGIDEVALQSTSVKDYIQRARQERAQREPEPVINVRVPQPKSRLAERTRSKTSPAVPRLKKEKLSRSPGIPSLTRGSSRPMGFIEVASQGFLFGEILRTTNFDD